MIDWQRVTDLKAEVGSEDFDEIVPIFLEEVAEVTERLRTAVILETLEDDLHFLKGSAMNLGFCEFSSLCGAGEASAAKGNAAAVDVTAILTSFDASRRIFLNGLADGSAA